MLLSFVIILQTCYKRSWHPIKSTHRIVLLSFVIILQTCYKRSWHLIKSTHHGMLLSFVIILQTLPLPNEDFGRRNKRRNTDFRSTFQRFEYSIWATNHWKVNRKSGFIFCSSFQNLRLGSINLLQKIMAVCCTSKCVTSLESTFVHFLSDVSHFNVRSARTSLAPPIV